MEAKEVIDKIRKHRDAAEQMWRKEDSYASSLRFNSHMTRERQSAANEAIKWMHRVFALDELLMDILLMDIGEDTE